MEVINARSRAFRERARRTVPYKYFLLVCRKMKRERDKASGKKRVRMRASYTNPPTDYRVAIDMSYDDLMDDKVGDQIPRVAWI